MQAVYVDGLANVLDQLPRPNCFLYISSSSVYGQTGGGWVDETAPTEPNEDAGRIVLEAENLLRAKLPDAIVLRFAGIYGFLTPSENAARPPGQWQSYDITLTGRMVTVVANGRTVISNQEIPGITGGAIDSNEGAPGPLLLQGDHGPVDFRNVVLTPLVK